jgi:hypothetical protein
LTRWKVTLYVESVKTTETEKVGRTKAVGQNLGVAPGGMAPPPQVLLVYDVESETTDIFTLPDDQKKVIQTVAEVAHEQGFRVKVVDVTRMNWLHRFLQKKARGVKAFPTLMTESGKKIEGGFSKEEIERFLSDAKE